MTPKLYRAFITPSIHSRDRSVLRYHYLSNIVTLPVKAAFLLGNPKRMTTTARTRRRAAARLRSRHNREIRLKEGPFGRRYRSIP